MKTPTFAPDLKIGQKVKVLWRSPNPDPYAILEIGSINSDRTKVLLKGFFVEFTADELVILRGELKEFTK